MCSWVPKPKFPGSEKPFFLNSYSCSFRPLSGIPFILAPQGAAGSSLLLPKVLMAYLALGNTEGWPLHGSSTLALPHTDAEAELTDARIPHGVLLFTLIPMVENKKRKYNLFPFKRI